MKAVIMAGGSGTRLRPLTCNIPKPLAPLCSKPVVEFILDLLDKNGFDEGIFTLMYKGDKIEKHFAEGFYKNIQLSFSYENSPLGTAGCVKQAASEFDEDFLVISGDAMCDFDLKKAIKFHKTNKADATIITKSVDDPREYGLVNAENNIITGFCEKPDFGGCFSNLANTGIYILSPKVVQLIENDKNLDFARDIFPLMLEKKMKLVSYQDDGYWCDIGDFDSYIQCQRDILSGKVNCEIDGVQINGGSIIRSDIPRGVTIGAPVYIGRNVKLSENVHIAANTILCDHIYVGENTKINGAIVLEGVHIGDNVTVNHAVICANAKLKRGSNVFENSIVGESCLIGEYATVNPGVKIWQNKEIPRGISVSSDVKYGVRSRLEHGDEGIVGATNIEITPQTAAVLGVASGTLSRHSVAISCSSDKSAIALKQAVISGICSTGRDVHDLGQLPIPMLVYGGKITSSDLLVHIESGINTTVKFFRANGLPLTRLDERQLEACINRGEYVKAGWLEFGQIYHGGDIKAYYSAMLSRLCRVKSNFNIVLSCENNELRNAIMPTIFKVSNPMGTGLEIIISKTGERVEFKSNTMGQISWEQLLLLMIKDSIEHGFDVAVPFHYPSVAERLAKKYGIKVHRFYNTTTDNSDFQARKVAKSQPYLFDGAMLALLVIDLLSNRKMDIKQSIDLLPKFNTEERIVKITGSSPLLINKLKQYSKMTREGVILERADGRILMKSNKQGNSLLLFAESYTSETAKSLCDDAERIISSLSLDNQH